MGAGSFCSRVMQDVAVCCVVVHWLRSVLFAFHCQYMSQRAMPRPREAGGAENMPAINQPYFVVSAHQISRNTFLQRSN